MNFSTRLKPETLAEFKMPKSRKQNSYTSIRCNVYRNNRRKRSEDEGMQCSCRKNSSNSLDAPKACDKDCLCAMLNYCCSPSCGCPQQICANKPFHRLPAKKLKVCKTDKCGWGAKADEDIRAGEFMIEYVGEIIDDKTCEERLQKMKEDGETDFYFCEISREVVIDARYSANKSRFINHSCQPNSELQKWNDGGETRIAIFAKTHINKGEFVTYDYGCVQFGGDRKCYCGAPNCSGTLGAKPKGGNSKSKKLPPRLRKET